jgi:GDP-mannose 6-dehydrogenase
MKISIVGLGYVGVVSAACFASRGHEVWGVDINPLKVQSLTDGKSPIIEPGLEEKVSAAVSAGNLKATSSIEEALRQSSLCLVSVATPSRRNGQIDASHLLRACRQIAITLRTLQQKQVVVIRSSVLPNVFEEAGEVFSAEAPGLVDLCVNPEFLREGTAIADFDRPPFTLIGTESREVETTLRDLYADLDAPVYVLGPKEATLVKYASNAFHALKVAFVNEISAVCSGGGIDAKAIMEVFCKDTKLNISSHYLRPGFAFGGSCLPKDIRALLYAARLSDTNLPLMRGILESNVQVIERAVHEILDTKARRVGLVGLSFKRNTDDLRESPFVELAERLIGKGLELRIYDPNVSVARLVGANREFIEHSIPHLSRVLVDSLKDIAEFSDLVVIGHNFDGIEVIRQERGRYHILDLTGQIELLERDDTLALK